MVKKKLRRYLFHVGRWTWYTGAAVLLLLVVGFTTARLLLPQLAERKDEIEAAINRVSPHAVRIEKLSTYWDGLHPGLHVHGLQVLAADRKTTALRLEEVRISLAWWPLLQREFEINNLEVSRPSLALERLVDGRFRLAGFDPVRPDGGRPGREFPALAISPGPDRDHRRRARMARPARAGAAVASLEGKSHAAQQR